MTRSVCDHAQIRLNSYSQWLYIQAYSPLFGPSSSKEAARTLALLLLPLDQWPLEKVPFDRGQRACYVLLPFLQLNRLANARIRKMDPVSPGTHLQSPP